VTWAVEAVFPDARAGFYTGEFGTGLLRIGGGEYAPEDMDAVNADWVDALSVDVWDRRVWTIPPNSQGYLTLAGAWIASRLPLPDDADDAAWAHLTIEAARQAAFDRDDVLHEGADGAALIARERLGPRRAAIDPDRAAMLPGRVRPGGTIFLCAVDSERRGVSLIQSNAQGYGAHIAEPSTGIFLHDRGIGFNLEPGHPAEYGPRRRPPHTLSPALVTNPDGSLHMVLGTMGGDTQPQILLQLLARLFHNREPVGDAVAAPRWALQAASGPGGFRTWRDHGRVGVALEPGTPPAWRDGLIGRAHDAAVSHGNYGHAHAIRCGDDHLEGASDPRALGGAVIGY
jgi:gamma-glutamyltranspeptidase / glutathione hydrolase